jgi:hypothetical protein
MAKYLVWWRSSLSVVCLTPDALPSSGWPYDGTGEAGSGARRPNGWLEHTRANHAGDAERERSI